MYIFIKKLETTQRKNNEEINLYFNIEWKNKEDTLRYNVKKYIVSAHPNRGNFKTRSLLIYFSFPRYLVIVSVSTWLT